MEEFYVWHFVRKDDMKKGMIKAKDVGFFTQNDPIQLKFSYDLNNKNALLANKILSLLSDSAFFE